MQTQVVIIGGGPGGAAQSMFLTQQGIRNTIIETDAFPRFHIGESMTGECGGIVRELGLTDYMNAAQWPRKQGVKVYGETGRNAWFVPVMQRLATGELSEQTTWQVRRSEFDSKMLEEAERRGAVVVRGKATSVERGADGAITSVAVTLANGETERIGCDMLVDASGQKNFLSHVGVTSEKTPGRYDRQIAVFSQFANTIRDRGVERDEHPDNTLIFYSRPYHWAWFIPLDQDTVSVGVVIPGEYFKSRSESTHDFLMRELRELHPGLSQRLPDLTPLEPVRAIPNYSFAVDHYTGKNWICLGDAHRFIDPIFSFGLFLTMNEARMATPHIVRFLNGETRSQAEPFAEHQRVCNLGVDRLQELIDGFWGAPLSFAYLVTNPRTRPGMIDLLAGRIYGDSTDAVLRDLRMLAEKARSTDMYLNEPQPS